MHTSQIVDLKSLYINHQVSLPTIINRTQKYGFWVKKRKDHIHDREVVTHYVGELIQHDASHHHRSPPAQKKWYLPLF
jgi:hypothetical protein